MPDPLPPRPRPADNNEGGRSYFTLFLAFLGCFIAAAFLLIMPTGFIGPVIVFGGFFFFGVVGLHYLVWGRWINQIVQDEQAEETD